MTATAMTFYVKGETGMDCSILSPALNRVRDGARQRSP